MGSTLVGFLIKTSYVVAHNAHLSDRLIEVDNLDLPVLVTEPQPIAVIEAYATQVGF